MRSIIISLLCLSLNTIGCTSDTPGKARTSVENQQSAAPTNEEVSEAYKHYSAFFSLSPTDTEAAHTALSKYIRMRFRAHPLADEWLKLVYRLNLDRKGTFPDVQRYVEGHLQMLTDIDPEERTKEDVEQIEYRQKHLRQLKIYSKILERQGRNPGTFEMGFNLK